VSHAFKTPLAAANGALELLGDHLPTMSEDERTHFLGVVAGSVARLEQLVRRLLDFARADMMRPASAAPVPLAPTLTRLAEDYRARGLDIRLEVGRTAVFLTEPAIEIVFAGLLDNVLHHAGRG